MADQINREDTSQLREVKTEDDLIRWDQVLGEIDFLALKILDYIYFKDLLTLHELNKHLSRFDVCSTTVKNRLKDLEDQGLIELVTDSNPLCLVKKLKLEERIKQLILLGYGKFEVKRDG